MGNHTGSASLNPSAHCWNVMRVVWRNQQLYSSGEGMGMVQKGRPLRDLFSLSNQQFLYIHTWCFRKVLVLNQQLLQSLHRLHFLLCYLCAHVPEGGHQQIILVNNSKRILKLTFTINDNLFKRKEKKRDDWGSLSGSEIFKSKFTLI